MAQEIEIKLGIAPGDHRRFMRQPLLRACTRRTDELLDTTYFDTPELELRAHGVALRVRKYGRQRVQTVKLAAHANGGLSMRPEWETPYRGEFDFSPIEHMEVRAWLDQPAIRGRLGPLFRTRFRRLTWHLPLVDGGEVLLALDRGHVLAGGAEEAISEVELELSGSEDVAALTTLAAQLGARLSLEPSSLSKAQRGYDLLARSAPFAGSSS